MIREKKIRKIKVSVNFPSQRPLTSITNHMDTFKKRTAPHVYPHAPVVTKNIFGGSNTNEIPSMCDSTTFDIENFGDPRPTLTTAVAKKHNNPPVPPVQLLLQAEPPKNTLMSKMRSTACATGRNDRNVSQIHCNCSIIFIFDCTDCTDCSDSIHSTAASPPLLETHITAATTTATC